VHTFINPIPLKAINQLILGICIHCCLFYLNALTILISLGQFLDALGDKPNTIIVTRARSNRVFYRQPEVVEPVKVNRGHPYRQRFDMEHMLRFGKQRLLMGSDQTPDVEHEENWVQLTLLAYVQLWAARELVDNLPRPWEKYHHKKNHNFITPSLVQRDFYRIIKQIGTPAVSPKPRGFSRGRNPGELREKRKRHPVIKNEIGFFAHFPLIILLNSF